ncbi:MAG: hypothetical protein OHK0046_19540 [Anaerolineae bacterium]
MFTYKYWVNGDNAGAHAETTHPIRALESMDEENVITNDRDRLRSISAAQGSLRSPEDKHTKFWGKRPRIYYEKYHL